MKNISIGIDFSKKTFDATVMRREDDTFTEVAYAKFENDDKGFKAFVSWVRKSVKRFPEGKGRGSWIFCGENTGVPSYGLCNHLASKGFFMWLENAFVIKSKSGIVRTKTDRVDSKRIAEYALRHYSDKVAPFEVDTKEYKRLASLYAMHNMLTQDKVAKNNQIKSGILDSSKEARKAAEKQLEWIEKQLKETDRQIREALEQSEEFGANYKILTSMKGVGPITAACLIIKTRNFKSIDDPRAYGNYVGVVPSHKEQSGDTVDKPARVSRYRDSNGNAVLTQCATSAIRHNPAIRAYYQRLVARGVHRNKAKNNCKFKIVVILFTMVKNGTEFDMNRYGKSKAQFEALSA